jgi:hypothetical protein
MLSKVFGIQHQFKPKKNVFMIFYGIIFGFIVPKEDKQPDPNEIQAMVNMHAPKNYNIFKCSTL